MIRVLLVKSMNVRCGLVPLKFRLLVDGDVDLELDTGKVVEAAELMSFRRDGCVGKGCAKVNESLKFEIERYKSVISEAFLSMVREGVAVNEENLRQAVRERIGEDGKRPLLRLAIRKNSETFAETNKFQGKWKQSTIRHLSRRSSPDPWIMQQRCVSTTNTAVAVR